MGVMRMRAICPNCGGKIHTQAKGLGHLTWMANGPLLVKTATTCQFCGIALTGKVDMQNRAILAQAPLPSTSISADGSSVVTNPDGTRTVTMTDGFQLVRYPDGTLSYGGDVRVQRSTTADGSKVVTQPDGTQSITKPDGTRILTQPNGYVTVTRPDGTKSVVGPSGTQDDEISQDITPAYEVTTETSEDGTVTHQTADGSILITEPDGTESFYTRNGSSSITTPDGTVSIEDAVTGCLNVTTPDGTKRITLPDRKVIVINADGTRSTTNQPLVGEFDGTQKLAKVNGAATGKATTGSEIVNVMTLPNGTAVTTYSDGRVVSVQLNGVQSVRHLDGTLDIDLANGQKTTIASDGKTVTERVDPEKPPTDPTQYRTVNGETLMQEPVLTAQADGSKGLTLKGGNTLTILDDGTMRLDFPDGREATIRIDGSTSFDFPDGREVWIYNEGTASVELRNGLKSWIHDDGTLSMDLPNGQEAWIYDDGSMELTDPPSDS